MPFMNGAQDGARMGKALREAYENVRHNAHVVLKNNNNAEGLETVDLSFAKSLLQYLAQRTNERFVFSFNTNQIQTRTEFVRKMFVALRSNDLASQMKLLDDKNILQFKGFFSSRLYDMLVERCGALRERLQANNMESVTTPCKVATVA